MIELVNCELDLPLSSRYGDFLFGVAETVNIETKQKAEHFLLYLNMSAKPLNVRINSACFTSDLFDDSRCDCHWQMVEFLQIMQETGQGLMIYHMHHEGRANGAIAKLRSYRAADAGRVGRDAYESIGLKAESREYRSSALILDYLGIHDIKLFSNNPEKITALKNRNIRVREPVPIKSPDPQFELFYKWKREHFGHKV